MRAVLIIVLFLGICSATAVVDESAHVRHKRQDIGECRDGNCEPKRLGRCFCSVTGDPHYSTCDGNTYSFQGVCNYRLMSTCGALVNQQSFEIDGLTENRFGMKTVSWLASVTVKVGGSVYTLGKGRAFTVNNGRATLPYKASPMVEVQDISGELYLKTSFGLLVSFDGDGRLLIDLPRSFANRTCGMCGNFNGNPDDDMAGFGSPAAYGHKYALSRSCPVPVDPPRPVCPPSAAAQLTKLCGMFTDPLSPFATCFGSAGGAKSANSYWSACEFDVCQLWVVSQTAARRAACSHHVTAATVCMMRGSSVNNLAWRMRTGCPLPDCGKNSFYTTAVNSCPSSCDSPVPSFSCPQLGREGCMCPFGMVRYGKDCVRRRECGCTDDMENRYLAGSVWLSNRCTVSNTCDGSSVTITTSSYRCPTGAVCRTNAGKEECVCPTGSSMIMGECKDSCAPNPCANGAKCVSTGSQQFVCICPSGYAGRLCTDVPFVCSWGMCMNGGTCVNGGDDDSSPYSCTCLERFTGARCQRECMCNPSGGRCIKTGTGFSCSCDPGYTGPLCLQNIDRCSDPNACKAGEKCVNTGNGNYYCTNVEPRVCSYPCPDQQQCIQTGSTITCETCKLVCPAGFRCELVGNFERCAPVPTISTTTVGTPQPYKPPTVPSGTISTTPEPVIIFTTTPKPSQCATCNSTCSKGGRCQKTGSKCRCLCLHGYYGNNCERKKVWAWKKNRTG